MTDNIQSNGINDQFPSPQSEQTLVLSRDELSAILRLLNLVTIPGLGEEPIPDLTDEQQAIAWIVAERGLRARGLALINEEGRLLIQRPVLDIVATCAFFEQSVFVTQIMAPEGEAGQFSLHKRSGNWVLHTRPDPVLHSFETPENQTTLLDRITQLCGWPRIAPTGWALTIPAEKLSQVRELASQGDRRSASSLLSSADDNADDIADFVRVLSEPHFVTVLQRITPKNTDEFAVTSITVLHQRTQMYVAIETDPRPSDGSDRFMLVQLVSLDVLHSLLADVFFTLE